MALENPGSTESPSLSFVQCMSSRSPLVSSVTGVCVVTQGGIKDLFMYSWQTRMWWVLQCTPAQRGLRVWSKIYAYAYVKLAHITCIKHGYACGGLASLSCTELPTWWCACGWICTPTYLVCHPCVPARYEITPVLFDLNLLWDSMSKLHVPAHKRGGCSDELVLLWLSLCVSAALRISLIQCQKS